MSDFDYDSLVDALTGVTGKPTVAEAMAYVSELIRERDDLRDQIKHERTKRLDGEHRHNAVQNEATNQIIALKKELKKT